MIRAWRLAKGAAAHACRHAVGNERRVLRGGAESAPVALFALEGDSTAQVGRERLHAFRMIAVPLFLHFGIQHGIQRGRQGNVGVTGTTNTLSDSVKGRDFSGLSAVWLGFD